MGDIYIYIVTICNDKDEAREYKSNKSKSVGETTQKQIIIEKELMVTKGESKGYLVK